MIEIQMPDSIGNQSAVATLSQMLQARVILFLAVVTIVCLENTAPVVAQSSVVGPAGSSVNRNAGSGERVLVLRTGRVMKGHIKTISTGWLVSTDRGNAVIPFEQVHFDADDLNESYLRLRIQGGRPTVASHLRLAEWCLSQNILAEAARELRDALEKDPANETARLMLDRVDTEIRRRAPAEPKPEPAQDVVLLTGTETSAEEQEVRSLSGLSPDTAREFVASIQPLLLNKCGNARCHGAASDNEFQLVRMRGGASNSRVVSEKNLAALLNHLQPGQDGQVAKLLVVIRGAHAGRTIFNGRYGSVQMQTLQRWARVATRELDFDLQAVDRTAFATRPATPSRSSITGSAKTVEDAAGNQRQGEPIENQGAVTAGHLPEISPTGVSQAPRPSADRNTATTSLPRSTSAPPTDAGSSPTPLTNVQRLLQEAKQHVRRQDAFDPGDFNRRYAGSRTQ